MKGIVTAKLILYDWGWRENIIYSSKAQQNEKHKGLFMIEKLRSVFGINRFDERKFKHELLKLNREAMKPTTYPEGKVPSPFSHIREKEKFKKIL